MRRSEGRYKFLIRCAQDCGVGRSAFLAAFFLACLAISAQAEEAAEKTPPDEGDALSFSPPKDGAPASRAGAGTRAADNKTGPLTLIAPEGGGETTLAAPPLVWHLAVPFTGVVSAGIADIDPAGAGVLGQFEGRFAPGYYAIDLRRSDMELLEGHIYRFTVSLGDGGTTPLSGEASAYVERVPVPASATEPGRMPAGSGLRGGIGVAARAAAAGLWFDALAPLIELDLSGRVRILERKSFEELLRSADIKTDDQ